MTNPIAGTRRRGKNEEEDNELKKELLADEKERAEHVMLVDLGRNDIAESANSAASSWINSWKWISTPCDAYRFESDRKLKPGLTCFEALSACLPVGTVSGAPKIRAMGIIDELEKTKRGIYAGAVGYFSYNGNMDTCIAIRTIILKTASPMSKPAQGLCMIPFRNRNIPRHSTKQWP